MGQQNDFSVYIGMREACAFAQAVSDGRKAQTTDRDGKYVPRPDAIWPGRLNFVVNDGVVTSVSEE